MPSRNPANVNVRIGDGIRKELELLSLRLIPI
jgi:hypothetical protein